jgi:hypothetical protein
MLQSTWVPDSVPTRCIVFGPIDEIIAMKSNAEITEAYADTGEILYHWRGRTKWIVVHTTEVSVENLMKAAEEALGEKPVVIEDPPALPQEPEAPLAPVGDQVAPVLDPVVEVPVVAEASQAGLLQPPQEPEGEALVVVDPPVA